MKKPEKLREIEELLNSLPAYPETEDTLKLVKVQERILEILKDIQALMPDEEELEDIIENHFDEIGRNTSILAHAIAERMKI
jgi:hypothetical protein